MKMYEMKRGDTFHFKKDNTEIFEFIKIDGMYGKVLQKGEVKTGGSPLDEVVVLKTDRRGMLK